MSKNKKIFKLLFWIISSIIIFAAVLLIAAYLYFELRISPKLSENLTDTQGSDISFADVAKEFTDKQVLDNLINFDKQSAVEMLAALNELGEEVAEESSQETKNDTESTVPDKEGTAYQRIMETASKDEISQGFAIISKIDMAKVNELRRQGKTAEIKEYIRSVLTSEEISTAYALYNKYKHLL